MTAPTSKPRAIRRLVICDDSNNPPSVDGHTVIIDVMIQTRPGPEFFHFRLPIDLESLEAGTLENVPVKNRLWSPE